jgi:CheY-like chemotaxis protein
MSVLIKGGRVITAADDYVADIYVEDETVTLIGESLDVAADKVIDATGKYVLPGLVDPHTHLDMPFGGTTTIDDVESGQTAAAFGGTTTHVDFCIQGKGQTFADALAAWHAKAEGKQLGLPRIAPELEARILTALKASWRTEGVRKIAERFGVDPNNGSIVYLGSRSNGLWKSLDHGATWNQVTTFPVTTATAGVGVVFVQFIKASATTGNTTPIIYVGVSDTGTGMSPEVRQRIFEPFFTTKDVGKGSGLGLSMVYGFVKQSNGHIKIDSEEGRGTTVRIYLPQAVGIAEPAESARPSSIEGGRETILVVEDDHLVRTFVVGQIQSLGYATLAAVNAAEALVVIDSPTEIDLLFTDMIMPGSMNGRQLADKALQRRSSLKILFTSGYSNEAIIHHGQLAAGVLLLAKPYRKSDLARMIRAALAV